MWSPEQKCCVYSVFSGKELSVFLRTAVCFLKFQSEYSALRYTGVKSLSTCCPFPQQPASPSCLLSQSPAPPSCPHHSQGGTPDSPPSLVQVSRPGDSQTSSRPCTKPGPTVLLSKPASCPWSLQLDLAPGQAPPGPSAPWSAPSPPTFQVTVTTDVE